MPVSYVFLLLSPYDFELLHENFKYDQNEGVLMVSLSFSFLFHSLLIGDVFAGVGPISVSAARKVKYVYANDLNPHAVDYLERNCVLNKLERKIEVHNYSVAHVTLGLLFQCTC